MAHRHLTLSNRYCIEELLKLRYSTLQISKKISYSETAIKKELNRNSIKGKYDADIAQKLYESRRISNNHKLSDKVKKLIISLLKKKISPELICGRLKHEGIVSITHKAIYNFIRKSNLKHLLFFKARSYNYRKERISKQGKIKDRESISDRPNCANNRQELYHFEGDTIVGKDHKGAIVTMVDRTSRFTILGKSANRTANSINRILYKASNGYKILLIMVKSLQSIKS